jgi:hypothetical protein
MFDPIAGSAPKVRERKHAKQLVAAKRKKRPRAVGKVMLTTATKKDLGDLEERLNRGKHPLFLLMLPGNVAPERLAVDTDESFATRREELVNGYLAEQHFAFLDLRVPQPLSIEWALFLWQRALLAQENTRLTVWFKQVAQGRDEQDGAKEDAPRLTVPLMQEAWLCRPNIPLLDADLKSALRDGRVSALREVAEDTAVEREEREAVPA